MKTRSILSLPAYLRLIIERLESIDEHLVQVLKLKSDQMKNEVKTK